MMEILILAIGAIAFWLLYGRNSDEPKPPMTETEARAAIQRMQREPEGWVFTKVILTFVGLTALLSWAGAYGLLAAAVVTVIWFWPK